MQIPSYVLMDIPHSDEFSLESLSLSPLGEACLRMDLTAIHEILEKTSYKDDEGITNEVPFYLILFLSNNSSLSCFKIIK